MTRYVSIFLLTIVIFNIRCKASAGRDITTLDTVITYRMFDRPYNVLDIDNLALPDSFTYTTSPNIGVFVTEGALKLYPADTGLGYVYCMRNNDTFFNIRVNIQSTPAFDSIKSWVLNKDTQAIFNFRSFDAEYMARQSLKNHPLPSFRLNKTGGGSISNDDIKGSPLSLMVFWYRGCGASDAIIDDFQDIKKHFGRNISVYSFFADSTYMKGGNTYFYYNKPVTTLKGIKFKKIYVKGDVTYPTAYNAKTLEKDFFFHGYPLIIAVDKKGITRYIGNGYSPGPKSEQYLIDQLELILHRVN